MVDLIPHYEHADQDIHKKLARVEAYRESVQRLPVSPKLAEYVNRLVVARAVHGTLAIEGSTLTEQEAQDLIASEEQAAQPERNREQKEVFAAKRAHQYVRENWGKGGERPIKETDILHIHRLLTETINYEHNVPGEYRHHPVQVGSSQYGGVYRPPADHEALRQLMSQFIDWVNSPSTLKGEPGPVRAILAHYFFVLIHPFGDGNGRVARVLESLILYQGGYNIKGFHSLANYYYKNRDAYFTLLQQTRTKYEGDQTQLLRFALQGLMEELQFIQDLIVARLKVVMFQDFMDEKLTRKELNGRQWAILKSLSELPDGIPWTAYRGRTDPIIGALYQKLTYKTLVRDLNRMIEKRFAKVQRNGDGKVAAIKARIEIMDQYV